MVHTQQRNEAMYRQCCSCIESTFEKTKSDMILRKFRENNHFYNNIDYIVASLFSYKKRIIENHSYLVNYLSISFAMILYIEAIEAKSTKMMGFMRKFIDEIRFNEQTRKHEINVEIKKFIFPLGMCLGQAPLSSFFDGFRIDFVTYSDRHLNEAPVSRSSNHENRRDDDYERRTKRRRDDDEYHEDRRRQDFRREEDRRLDSLQKEITIMRDRIRFLESELSIRDRHIDQLMRDRSTMIDRLQRQDSYIQSVIPRLV